MEEPQTLYGQTASYFTLTVFLQPDAIVRGAVLVALGKAFLADVDAAGCVPIALWTKRPGIRPTLNMGAFSERRWNAAVKKLAVDDYAVVDIEAQRPDAPGERARFSAGVNPAPGIEEPVTGTLGVHCSLSYLRRLAASPERVERLLDLGVAAWNGADGGAAYGYGNIAVFPKRPSIATGDFGAAPAERVHAVPVACTGQIDGNLHRTFAAGHGIKGAFWANYLSPVYAGMLGGEAHLRSALAGMRIDRLGDGGLLVVATASPLPEDSEETRRRFDTLYRVLQPAFIARAAVTDIQRPMLGYFYRERPDVVP